MIVNPHQYPFRSVLFALLFLSSLSPALGQGGSPLKQVMTAVNMIARDTVSGLNLDINLASPLPKHGDVDIVILQTGGSGNPYVYEITYTPDPGFTGVDTFTLEHNYLGTFPYLVYQAYRVAVYPSLLYARPDFATTTAGTPVTVAVLSNDTGTELPLLVSGTPLSDHGTAAVNGNNEIIFTPAPGFTGIAHVNYTVCDTLNTCKTGSLTVGVNNNNPAPNDTLRLATARNTALTMPLKYDSFTVFQSAVHGSLSLFPGGHTFRYAPDFNYTGADQFVLVNNTYDPPVYTTVLLQVLNTPTQNTMAMDDYVFTPVNKPISFNVRTNDIGNLTVKSWLIPNNLPGTVSGTNPGGNVTFTPNTGFSGVATFYYKLGNMFVPDIETGTIHVVVGNQAPNAGVFDLTTPVETPLVINYEIPFIGFDFSITDPPEEGDCVFYPGFTTLNINGQTVSGHNLLVYTPEDDFVGTDEFDINYCITSTGQCQTVKVVTNVVDVISAPGPYCVDDCVWAGDVNSDGVVNNRDILPLGYFMGFDGADRPNAALEWFGQFAPNWNNPYTGSTRDLKHCDTDGDGTVTADDTLAVSFFYGQTHQLIPQVPPSSKGLPFFLEISPANPQVGDLVTVKVSLGNNDNPVTDLYGFTFDVSLSPLIVDSALQMRFYDNSWINLNAPYVNFWKSPHSGRLETAFTRTSGVTAHGRGPIGEFSFIIIDIVDITRPEKNPFFTITVDQGIMGGDSQVSTGDPLTINVPLRFSKKRSANTVPASAQDLVAFPNPARNLINFHLNGDELIESLQITDMAGRIVFTSGAVQTAGMHVDLSNFDSGLYVAMVRTKTGQLAKKFQVQR